MDICRRLNIGDSEKLRTFLSGLRPELEEYVRLQRPKDAEEAFTHATLKESIPSSNGLNQETLAKALQQAIAANAATRPTVAAIDTATHQNFATKEDVIAIIQSQNRQPQGHPGRNFSPPQGGPYNAANYRNHRTFDARPVCNFCHKRGHTMNSCYQFQRSHNQGPQNQFRPTQYGNEGYSGYPRIPRPWSRYHIAPTKVPQIVADMPQIPQFRTDLLDTNLKAPNKVTEVTQTRKGPVFTGEPQDHIRK